MKHATSRHARLLLGLLALGAFAPALSQVPGVTVSDTAAVIAEAMAPREQMRGMVLATLARTTTATIISNKLGQASASALFAAKTDEVVNRYGGEWGGLLAASYRESLSAEELSKAESAIQARDRAAMMPLMARVGPAMQRKATPLLQRASEEALKAAYEQMTKEPAQ